MNKRKKLVLPTRSLESGQGDESKACERMIQQPKTEHRVCWICSLGERAGASTKSLWGLQPAISTHLLSEEMRRGVCACKRD